MLTGHKKRNSVDITSEILVKRLETDQLIGLVGLKGYEPFQDKIFANLQTRNGFTLANFQKVHPISRGCVVTEEDVGKTLPVVSVDPTGEFPDEHYDLPLMRLKCEQHPQKVVSRQFINNFGTIREEPFIPRFRF